jgi:hypothetical protein
MAPPQRVLTLPGSKRREPVRLLMLGMVLLMTRPAFAGTAVPANQNCDPTPPYAPFGLTVPDNFSEAVKVINELLKEPEFTGSSQSTFAPLDDCKVNFVNDWSSATSAAKGYAAVETVTPIDLRNDIIGIEHVFEHDERKDDHVERWGDSIKIIFSAPISSSFKTKQAGDADWKSVDYAPPFVSISAGVPGTDDADNALRALSRLVQRCRRARN